MKRDSLFYLKLLMLALNIAFVIRGVDNSNVGIALILVLICAFNVQIRMIFLNESFFILSLLGDILLIYLIQSRFSGLCFSLIYITLLDGVIYSERFNYAAILISGISLAYFIYDYKYDIIALSMFIFAVIAVLGTIYKAKIKKINEVEQVYDEVRKYSYELEAAKKQIELYSQQVENLASVKERQRISEEIHDTIGHRLTALLMQMEAGIRLLDSGSEQGRELLGMSLENLRESIDVLRQTVRSIKPKEYRNIIYTLEELIRKFQRETGVNVKLEVKGSISKLYPGVEMVLYKNAQEALTNAVRHGRAGNILIKLIYEENVIVLRVENDGEKSSNIKKGMGITGMEERLRFVGGMLNIDNSCGFAIESRIPIGE